MRSPDSFGKSKNSIHSETKKLYYFYHKYISPVYGDKCLMYPSCSLYSKEAFEKYGVLKGFILTIDRLNRCSKDFNQYKIYFYNNREYLIDNVEDNVIKRIMNNE